jgi:hypothetical protein
MLIMPQKASYSRIEYSHGQGHYDGADLDRFGIRSTDAEDIRAERSLSSRTRL